MKKKINNNYFYYIKNKDYIDILDYIFLLSIIQIQKPNYIFIYHNQIFNTDDTNDTNDTNNSDNSKSSTNYYFKLIKNINLKIWTSKIIFKKINDDEYKEKIKKDMIKYGGIYIFKQCLLLKSLENFLIHDYIELNNICIGIKKDTDKISNEDLLINLNINKNKINEKSKNEISYFNINENIVYKAEISTMSNSIYDYNFEEYFNIIYNFYFIEFNNIEKQYEQIINNFNNNNINLINLIIYYLLGYSYYFNNQNQNQNQNQLINEKNKIFYLNLKKHNLRNNNTINILNNFDIEYKRVEGIYGNEIENIKSVFFNEKQTINNNTNTEYAVLLSHLNVIRNAEKEEGKYFLILEDDICLDFMDYWKKSIKEIINEAPSDWEIIMLNYFTLDPKFETDYRLWNNEWSALSYIIKKSSIKKIETIINPENNKYNLYDDVNVADNYIFRLFKTYVYKYAYFTIPNNNKSTFHNDHDNYQKIYKNMNYLILNDIFDKYF